MSRSVTDLVGLTVAKPFRTPTLRLFGAEGSGKTGCARFPVLGAFAFEVAQRRGVASRLGSRRDRLGVCQGLLGVAVDKGAHDLEVLILLLELDQVSAVLEHNELRAGHGAGDVLR